MIATYVPLLVLGGVAAALAGTLLAISHLFGPKRWNARKLAPYECGVTPLGNARERFPVKFFAVAILFILFDVEAAFFYPAALVFREMGVFGLLELGLFLAFLLLGYFYLLARRALDQDE